MTKCSTFDPVTRSGENAVIVTHTAVVVGAIRGEPVCFDRAKLVRRFFIGQPKPHAQHPVSVQISFVEPRQRTSSGYRAIPTDNTYYTVEDGNGRVFYDSRQDVPCNMERFAATGQRFTEQWQDRGYAVDATSPVFLANGGTREEGHDQPAR